MKHTKKLQWATLALCSLSVQADVILLKNGDKITGTVVNKSGSVIEMKTDYSDKLIIEWDAVKSLKSDVPMTIILDDKQQLTGLAEFAPDGSMKLKSPGVYDTQPIALTHLPKPNLPNLLIYSKSEYSEIKNPLKSKVFFLIQL